MANVMFKRGLQSKLPSTAVNGAFYLTTDTNRLYVGVADGKAPVLLNQTIQFIDSLSALNTMSNAWTSSEKLDHKNDIYYIVNGADGNPGNILATWDGSKWIQINPDSNTYVTGFGLGVQANGDTAANATFQITDNAGNQNLLQTLTLQGANGIKVGVSGKVITFTGDTYSLDNTVANNEATVTLASANTDNDSSITIKGGNNVSITTDSDKKIIVNSTDTYVNQVRLSVSNGELTTSIAQNDPDKGVSSNAQKLYFTLGDNATEYGINGSLPVYTQTEVDNLFKQLNGLTYVGTVGQNGLYSDLDVTDGITGLTDIHNGDMFMVSGGEVTYNAGGSKAHQGDLLIATGSENADGVLTSITWNYVPSGDDTVTDTTYSFNTAPASNRFAITNNVGTGGLQVTYTDGTAIDVVSTDASASGVSGMSVAINHADVSHTDSTGTAVTGSDSFKAITKVEVNAQGHVTEVETTDITVPKYSAGAISVTKGTDPNVTSSAVLTNALYKDGTYVAGEVTNIVSDTLVLDAPKGNTMSINLEWGEF